MRRALFIVAGLVIGQANAESPPKDFPRVSQLQQESRDSERRRILEEELKAEQDRLAESAATKDAVAMARHAGDIQSLSKELGLRVPVAAVTVKEISKDAASPFGKEAPEAFGSAQ